MPELQCERLWYCFRIFDNDSNDKERFIYLEVPFVKQGEYECSETAATMIFLYFGLKMDKDRFLKSCIKKLQLKKIEKPVIGRNVYFENMLPCMAPLTCEIRRMQSIEEVITELEMGRPVIARVQSESDPDELHSVVVNGYLNGFVGVTDPALGFIWYEQNYFTTLWKASNCSVMYCKYEP